MFSSLRVIILAAAIPQSAYAQCVAQKPENFQRFFDTFAASKQFALSRTLYPLKIETSRNGIDAQGRQRSGISVSFRSAQEDARGESLSGEMERNALSYKILSLGKGRAVVNVSGQGDGFLFNHHFARKGNCWFEVKLEDYSI